MKSSSSNLPMADDGILIQLDRISCWTIYFRLQQLSIPCACATGEPLRVSVDTAGAAILLWSIIRRVTAPLQDCRNSLERCWQLEPSLCEADPEFNELNVS